MTNWSSHSIQKSGFGHTSFQTRAGLRRFLTKLCNSSVHRKFGRVGLRRAVGLTVSWCTCGFHSKARCVHLCSPLPLYSSAANFHFLFRACSTQVRIFNRLRLFSTLCVTRLIHSTHGSNSSLLSSSGTSSAPSSSDSAGGGPFGRFLDPPPTLPQDCTEHTSLCRPQRPFHLLRKCPSVTSEQYGLANHGVE